MIAAELAERRLVQLKQNLAQLLGIGIAGCETLSVNLSQRADEGVSVFAADFAILVAVAIVETCLAHAGLHCSRDPPAGTKWQQNAGFKSCTVAAMHMVELKVGSIPVAAAPCYIAT